MRKSVLVLAAAMLLPMAGSALADTCSDVAEDTVAELRAGAAGWWNDEIAALVRASAGSACVKALSGRYAAQASANAEKPVAPTSPTTPVAPTADAAADDDDGSWNMGGLTVRSLSGSPAKKPYQRQREQNDQE